MTNTSTTLLTSTPALAWKKAREEGELYTLPGSGNVARLIRPSLTALVGVTNGVPNPLSKEVMRLLAAAPPGKAEEALFANIRNNSRAYMEIARMCLVEPRLALDKEPNYERGEIGPNDLADLDYAWIYHSFVEGAAADAAPFRVAEPTQPEGS